MASTADGELGDATEPDATPAERETRSNQGSNTPDTTRNPRADHDASEIHRPPCQLFTLPPEIRSMIFGFICTKDSMISLPGPLPPDIATLMLASKEASWRAEVFEALWQNWWIEWQGSLNSRTWQRFKKTAIPLIRRLIINFELTNNTWFALDSDIRQALGWMWQRSKHGNRARYRWYLEQLHLRGVRYRGSSCLSDGTKGWSFSSIESMWSTRMHWSQDYALERLRTFGITVSVEIKRLGPYS